MTNYERREGFARGRNVSLVIALGTVLFIQAAWRLPCISRDGVFFVEFAEQIRADPSGAMAGQTKQPGYSILLLGLHSLIGQFVSANAPRSWEICGQIIAVTGGVAAVWLIYFLTRRLFDVTTALVAALLAAFWPQLVTLSSDVLSDAPHLALYLAGLLIGLRAMGQENAECGMRNAEMTKPERKDRWFVLAACGVVCGAAYWLRQEALGAVAAVVICMLWPTSFVALRRRVALAAVVVAAFVAVVAPHSIMVGKVMPNKSIKDLLYGAEKRQNTSGAPGPKRQTEEMAGPVVWWDAPVKMAAGWGKSGRYVLSTLAIAGFFWGRVPRSETCARRLLFVAALLQVIAAQARGMQYGIVSDRYLLIPAALSIPWSAAGLAALSRFIGERLLEGREAVERSNVARRSFTVAALIAMAPMAYYDLRPSAAGADWEREAGAWISGHASTGDVVFAAHQRSPVAFYAGLARRWPAGDGLGSAAVGWVVDDPGMSRITNKEKALLTACRELRRANAPSRTWIVEGGREAQVYRIGSD